MGAGRAHEGADPEPAAAVLAPPATAAPLLGNRALGMLARDALGAARPGTQAHGGASGVSRAGALTRALAARAPLSNRAVGRLLARDPKDPPAAAPGVDEEPGTPIRKLILAEARKAVGATEFGDDKRFESLFGKSGTENPTANLEAERIKAGKKDAVHTTCIDFQVVVWSRAREALQKAKLGTAPKYVTPLNAPSFKGWVNAEPGMDPKKRPRPGDLYVLSKIAPHKDGEPLVKGKFSHEGYVESIRSGPSVGGASTEIWTTIDGGQGSKTTYDAAGNLVGTHGAESILRTARVYIPSKNLITGEANQDADQRLLTGWLDVDSLVTPPA